MSILSNTAIYSSQLIAKDLDATMRASRSGLECLLTYQYLTPDPGTASTIGIQRRAGPLNAVVS